MATRAKIEKLNNFSEVFAWNFCPLSNWFHISTGWAKVCAVKNCEYGEKALGFTLMRLIEVEKFWIMEIKLITVQ